MQAAVAEHFAEERAKAIKVRQEGKEDVVRALFGCKVVSALGPDSAFARPGDLVVGEPRFSFVVKAPRSGTLNSLRVKVGDKIGAASVLGSVGDVSITSPVEGIILTLLVLDGAFVKKDDMIAWVYSPHNFVWTVYER